MRPMANKAKVCTIVKLNREVKRLRTPKSFHSEEQRIRNTQKAERLLEELLLMKTFKHDKISKFALSNTKREMNTILAIVDSSVESRCLCRIASHQSLSVYVNKLQAQFPQWASDVLPLIEKLGVKEKQKNKFKNVKLFMSSQSIEQESSPVDCDNSSDEESDIEQQTHLEDNKVELESEPDLDQSDSYISNSKDVIKHSSKQTLCSRKEEVDKASMYEKPSITRKRKRPSKDEMVAAGNPDALSIELVQPPIKKQNRICKATSREKLIPDCELKTGSNSKDSRTKAKMKSMKVAGKKLKLGSEWKLGSDLEEPGTKAKRKNIEVPGKKLKLGSEWNLGSSDLEEPGTKVKRKNMKMPGKKLKLGNEWKLGSDLKEPGTKVKRKNIEVPGKKLKLGSEWNLGSSDLVDPGTKAKSKNMKVPGKKLKLGSEWKLGSSDLEEPGTKAKRKNKKVQGGKIIVGKEIKSEIGAVKNTRNSVMKVGRFTEVIASNDAITLESNSREERSTISLSKSIDSFFFTEDGKSEFYSSIPQKEPTITNTEVKSEEVYDELGRRLNRRQKRASIHGNYNLKSKRHNSFHNLDYSHPQVEAQPTLRDSTFHKQLKETVQFDTTSLHPSWEAKRKQKEHLNITFQGKKILFDD